MGLIISGLIIALISGGTVLGSLTLLKRGTIGGASGDKDKLISEIEESTKDLRAQLVYKDSYASKGQLTQVESLVEKARADLEKEKATLKEIESKLDTAQKQVGEKETHQQDVKSAKMEDESKLQDLLARHQDLSAEAIALEQKLAQSMKNLDALLNELELTQDQKAVLQELNNTLTNAGSRLRDLLTEYNGVNERLQTLSQQHLDLEDEYTKLVEQQLGD